MEPYHQLRFSHNAIGDIDLELVSLGITVTHRSDSWLGHKYPQFHDLVCSREDQRSLFAVGPDSSNDEIMLMVYVNTLDDTLTADIRLHFESRGAKWGYFDS